MGEVMVARDQSIDKVLDHMRRSGIDERSAIKKIIDLGIRDYVSLLFKEGEISIRDAAEILQLDLWQTLEILEERVGGNVGHEEEMKALRLARKLAERS